MCRNMDRAPTVRIQKMLQNDKRSRLRWTISYTAQGALRDSCHSASPGGPNLSEIRPDLVEFGPNLVAPVRRFAEFGRTRGEVGIIRATVGRARDTIGRGWPTSGQIASDWGQISIPRQLGSTLADNKPKLVKIGPDLVRFGKLGGIRAKLGRIWPILTEVV